MYGAIEAGGTKFVCAMGNEQGEIVRQITLPTTRPEETMKAVFEFFEGEQPKAFGIASFGPIDADPKSATYGYITTTPKEHWANFDFVGAVKARYDVPVYWTTDVNGSCLGEYTFGAGKDINSCLYLTIGTGVGGGVIIDGNFLGGAQTPEMGHVPIRKHPKDDFPGICPYHGDCLEGLTAGPSVAARYGVLAQDLPSDHEVWDFLADYLGQALVGYTLTLRPERLILGGGVMHQPLMPGKVRSAFERWMNGYIKTPPLEEYIVTPGLGDQAGIIGALLLARRAAEEE